MAIQLRRALAALAAVLCIWWGDASVAAAAEASGAKEASDHELRDPGQAEPRDSLLGEALSLGAVGALYAGMWTWAYFAWYRDLERTEWTWNDDGLFRAHSYAGGADKLGHVWANHLFVRGTAGILRFGGWSPWTATLIATVLDVTYFLAIEYKDAFRFGFSVGDQVANLAGTAFAIATMHVPALDAIVDFKVSYWPSDDYRELARRTGTVNFAEDYTGQTYLLAFHAAAIEPLAEHRWLWPLRYADAVVGFQAIHYKPIPTEPSAVRRQRLFFGVALNLGRLLDDTLLRGADPDGALRGSIGFVNEMVQLPYTTLSYPRFERSPDE
jgi:hypothetical protein